MREKDILALFRRLNVIIPNGHFRYSSGGHGCTYVNKDALYLHSDETSRLCYEIARRALLECGDIDCVVGSEKGGIILSQWVGFHLAQKERHGVLSIFAEKVAHTNASGKSSDDFDFIFTRGYGGLIAGKNVFIVEDVVNRGGSVRKVVDLVRKSGGNVKGVGALWNRGNASIDDASSPPTFFSLVNTALSSWTADTCPMCRDGIPLDTQLGKGKILPRA